MSSGILIERGRKLLDENIICFMDKAEIELSPKTDWAKNPFNDRTWMWHLHQMSFIETLLAYDINKSSFFGVSYAIELIKSWDNQFKDNLKDPFAWHDHATAIRARHLVSLLVFLKNSNAQPHDISYLEGLCITHAKQLRLDSFYTKATNHGLDQSMALYVLANTLKSNKDSTHWIETSVKRINFEISHAFAKDGGHIENSPSYLVFGLKQALEALKLATEYKNTSSNIYFSPDIFSKAVEALTFIVRPDGKLPFIGDTKDFAVRDFIRSTDCSTYNNFLYSISNGKKGTPPSSNDLVLKKSGWAIFRSSWDKNTLNGSTQIVFKCGFLSNYHRHDDDLHFTLFAHGEEWLIDGGEYKHAPKDLYRIYFRSAESHNISMPYSVRAHRVLSDSSNTGIKSYDEYNGKSSVYGASDMFDGYVSYRTLAYHRDRNKIKVNDICYPVKDPAIDRINNRVNRSWVTYVTRFMIPNNKQIVIDTENKCVRIIGKSNTLVIDTRNCNGAISVKSGQQEPSLRGWRSTKSGALEKAYSLELQHMEYNLDFEYTLSWEDSQKNTSNIEISTAPDSFIKANYLDNSKSPPVKEQLTSNPPKGPQIFFEHSFVTSRHEKITLKVDGLFSGIDERAIFLEDHVSVYGIRETILGTGASICLSNDAGESWRTTKLSAIRAHITRCFTLRSGEHLLQTTNPFGMFLASNDFSSVTCIKSSARYNWHGSWSIDQSQTGTICFGEYCDRDRYVQIVRSVDGGKTWHDSLVIQNLPGQESSIRHFHLVQSDPYISGRWYASSGDINQECRFWISDNDAQDWAELGRPNLTGDHPFNGIEQLNSIYRFVALHITQDHIYWPTDDLLRRKTPAFFRMSKQPPFKIDYLCDVGGQEARTCTDLGDGRLLSITQSNKEKDYVEVHLLGIDGFCSEVAQLPSIISGNSSFCRSLASKKAVDGYFFTYAGADILDARPRTMRWKIINHQAMHDST